jgi:hypothetical protein
MKTIPPMSSLLLLLLPAIALAQGPERMPSPKGAMEYVISPQDGATVKSPVTVRFGLKGMGVAPAGVKHENTGHHHLFIDLDQMPPQGQPLPANDHIRHFGGGQTQTQVDLQPGKHTLQIELADALHVPFDPPVISKKITITVVE